MFETWWHMVSYGRGKWRGNWRMEWVASTLTLPQNVVYPALLTQMGTPWLPAVDWTDAPADLNGLVSFGERWNLVSACVPSHFKCTLLKFIRPWPKVLFHVWKWCLMWQHVLNSKIYKISISMFTNRWKFIPLWLATAKINVNLRVCRK